MSVEVAETTTTPAIVRSSESVPSHVGSLASAVFGVSTAVLVAGLGFSYGGYFPTAWAPTTLVFLGISALALVVRPRSHLGLRELAIPGLLVAYTCWALVSSSWGSSTEVGPEVQRTLVYVTGSLAFALVVRRAVVASFATGLWGGICVVSLYALATRLFPDRLGEFDPIVSDYRLSDPVGYWNALGLLAALGVLLALWLTARADYLAVRLAAAASTVPLVLTLYFTFSRGAWVALGAGVVVTLALDPRRLQLATTLILVAPWSALVLPVAARSDPLTEFGHTLSAATADGHALSAIAAGLALAAAAAAAFLAALERRVDVSTTARRVSNLALGGAVVAVLAAVVLALGGPAQIGRSFAAPPKGTGADLDDHLFDLNGSGRVEHWRVALHVVEDEPLSGSGAGSYERYWLAHRPYEFEVRDAHSLYLETLAELGPLGLALVAAVFGGPLVAAVLLRRRPYVPAAAGALVAYMAHAGIDWDWEFPVLTLVALGCISVILPARDEEPTAPFGRSRVALLVAVMALVPVAAIGGLGARAQAASADAVDDRHYDRAAAEARTAERLAPWSVEPVLLLGRAQAAAGDRRAARATFRRALGREPDSWRLWYELAAVSSGAARRAALREARALNPLEPLLDDLQRAP